ncbi:MAG: UDP-2,3-diacylglucosamine diphosphatase LpxI [Magnetococcales bacterium]|nr:UDP-2,3-diacylglucosamine diphosphatase LpxI [Magnetococcales bacterium]
MRRFETRSMPPEPTPCLGDRSLSLGCRVGLVAGSGQLPLLFARAMRVEGRCTLVAVAHHRETDPMLEEMVDQLLWVRLGQFRRILDFLARCGVEEVVFAGGITKASIWRARPDTLALRLVAQLRHLHDDLLLRAVAGLVESRGFRVRGVTDYLPDLLVPAGQLTRQAPTAEQWEDIHFGWQAAKALGQLDIGQGVVVRGKNVVAVEAMEGTDAMICRAGHLSGGKGILVKVSKPTQDRRLDMPTIGPGTIQALLAARLPVLVVEAGGVILLDPATTLAMADRHRLAIVATTDADMIRGAVYFPTTNSQESEGGEK